MTSVLDSYSEAAGELIRRHTSMRGTGGDGNNHEESSTPSVVSHHMDGGHRCLGPQIFIDEHVQCGEHHTRNACSHKPA